jgi:transposase
MSRKELSNETALLADLLDLTLKLRYENEHMRKMLDRMGITPQFPVYQDHKMSPEKEAA